MADKVDQEAFWDERFRAEDYVFGTQPNAFLAEQVGRLEDNSEVLAVADGEGRNSVFLASHGHRVTAIDISQAAIDKAERLAQRQGVDVRYLKADLVHYDWSARQYNAIVSIFIQFAGPAERQHLFAGFERALKPGGLLIMQGYRPEQLDYGTGGPPHAENMYTEPMLREAFDGWKIELLRIEDREIEEGFGHRGMSALIDLVARSPKE